MTTSASLRFVLKEAALGDPQAAQDRLDLLSDMTLLPIAPEALP